MSAIIDSLFTNDKGQVVLSTFAGDYTSQEIKVKVDYYLDLLKEKNIERKKIGLLVPMIPSYLALVLAVNKLGGTVVPLSWQFRKDDLNSVLKFLDPHIVFTVKEYNGFPFGEIFDSWATETKKETVIYETNSDDQWRVNTYSGEMKQLEQEKMDFICCSSGSTGTPKGMIVSTSSFNFTFQLLTDFTELHPADRLFLNAPPNNVFGIASLLNGLYNGAKVVFPDSFELTKMVKLMDENKCNKVMSTPSIFKAIYQVAKELNPNVLNKLELVGLAGEMVTEDYMKQFQLIDGCKFISMYGSSEIGGAMSCDISGKIEFTIYKDVDHKIEDSELLLKSPAVFTGYYKDPNLTQQMFDKDGWLLTGDLVRENEKGKIEIIGRKKDMIKKGGQQVIPGEIEQLLVKHNSVKQAVVIGTHHSIYGEQIVAFVVPNGEVDPKSLVYFCSKQIAGYKVPDQISIIDEVPISQAKIDKVTLRQMYQEGVKRQYVE